MAEEWVEVKKSRLKIWVQMSEFPSNPSKKIL